MITKQSKKQITILTWGRIFFFLLFGALGPENSFSSAANAALAFATFLFGPAPLNFCPSTSTWKRRHEFMPGIYPQEYHPAPICQGVPSIKNSSSEKTPQCSMWQISIASRSGSWWRIPEWSCEPLHHRYWESGNCKFHSRGPVCPLDLASMLEPLNTMMLLGNRARNHLRLA